MKTHINFQYNKDTKQCDLLADGVVIDHFSSADVSYLTRLSIYELWSGRCQELADKHFGKDNYLLDYFIDGGGYKINNVASEF